MCSWLTVKKMNENEKRDWGFSVNNEGKTDPQINIPQKSVCLKEDPDAPAAGENSMTGTKTRNEIRNETTLVHPGSSSCRYSVPTLLCQSERDPLKADNAAGDPSMPP